MKYFTITLFLFFGVVTNAQVGINTITPNAQLEIQSTNQALPANTDGILIPKIDVFPASNPTIAQQGMLVYLTTATTFSGNPKPIGFYYWNDSPADWIAVKGTDGGTLDQAYDFGGAGLGKTITADSGAVLINGTDGLVSTGTSGSGALAPSGAGTRMVWNPRKAAFRAGTISGTSWDDSSIGFGSVAFTSSTASGTSSFAAAGGIATGQSSFAFGTAAIVSVGSQDAIAFGIGCQASNFRAVSIGAGNIASGGSSAAIGSSNTSSGSQSIALGSLGNAVGSNSMALGRQNTSSSFGETVIGIGATTYTPSANGDTQFRTANSADRLFVIGNAIDANNNNTVDVAERSDALVVLKNGNIGIGSSTPQDKLHIVGNLRMEDGNQATGKVLTSDANGTASWQNASTNAWGLIGNSGMNPVTNFVGTTDAQPLRFRTANTFSGNISNTMTGLVSLGLNAGPSNTGLGNTFIGGTTGVLNTSGASNTFVGQGAGAANTTTSNNTYLGTGAGQSNASGSQNVYVGRLAGGNGTSGSDNILIGNGAGLLNTANNNVMIGSFAGNGNSTGGGNTFMGSLAGSATSTGGQNTFIGNGAGSTNSTGTQNTLIGNGAAVNANNLTNATAIGRGSRVDVNDGLVLGSVNGVNASTSTSLVGIGTTAPLERLHVVGNIRMVDGNQAAGRVLTSDGNGTATWQNASNNAWGLTGNAGTSAAVNFIGTTDAVDVVFKRNNIKAGLINSTNSSFGLNSLLNLGLGNSNSAFGLNAMATNTSGSGNSAFGETTLFANINGGANSAFGSDALASNTTGSSNSAFGDNALDSNTAADSNSAFGSQSLNSSTGQRNSAFGALCLNVNTTGSENAGLGYYANVAVGNLTNATAIGARAEAGASNTLVLGSIAGVNTATSSVNVGIGTSTPQATLEVVDANAVTSSTGEGIINVMSNDPQATDLGGSITLGGTNNDAATTYRIFGTIEGRKANSTTASNLGYLMFKTNNGVLGERMRITSSGDVGIGTAAPGGQFELSLNEGRKPGTNTWTIVSDKRLKTINGNYTKGLSEILQLNPIRFNYINNGDRKFEQKVLDTEFPGFIAQEVQPLFPDAVGTDADGFLNFNMHPILIASINAFKELNQKNVQLQRENEALKTLLDVQKNSIEAILLRLEKLEKNN